MEELFKKILINILTGRISKFLDARLNKTYKNEDPLEWKKRHMLLNINRLYELPNFSVSNATTNSKLVNLFYCVSIDVILTCNIDSNHIGFVSRNYLLDCDHKSILAYKLNRLRFNMERNDSRYTLGFRSLSFILHENIENLTVTYIQEKLDQLRPFFSCYSHSELLNHYALYDLSR